MLYLILSQFNKYIILLYNSNTFENIYEGIFLVLHYYRNTHSRFCEIRMNKCSNKLVLTENAMLHDKR